MHRLVQFQAIARSDAGHPSASEISPPEKGNFPADLLTVLCGVVAQHTSTKGSCWFCLWDGYGWIDGSPDVSAMVFGPPGDTSNSAAPLSVPPGLPLSVRQGARVSLPQRNYFLFKGPLLAASELGWTTPWESFDAQSPNLFWPQDHAWCVATDIDLFCTLIGGSEKLADALVAEPRLETWRVFFGDPIAWDSDMVNTRPSA
ncbi:MAG TPA: hypothetical protein VHZ55_15085 [Bryobacteraceae bacterium]|jgi:hypothetical protein|nr:hypothetical protein [Bryobacteraceae bacterium]